MECQDAKLRVQALIDNELPEEEIDSVVDHLQSCYRCREEYLALLKLQRKMKGVHYPEPPKEWFEQLSKRRARAFSSTFGLILFIGSYLVLLGYALYSLFIDSTAGLFIKIVIGAIIAGILFLSGVTISDRVQESKTDKYKEVMK